MRIIATNGQAETCIVELHKDELGNLVGFYSFYGANDKVALVPGKELPISKMYAEATEILGMYQETRKELESGLKRMVRLNEIVQYPKPIKAPGSK